MSDVWAYLASLYVAGVVWGLFVIDAAPAARAALALLWPIGPAALIVTLAILVVAAAIAFPALGAAVIAAVALAVWMSR
jgi:hypothetical protein